MQQFFDKILDTGKEIWKQSSEIDKELAKKLSPEAAERTLNMRSWMDFGLKLLGGGAVLYVGYALYKGQTRKDEQQKSLDSHSKNSRHNILGDRRDDHDRYDNNRRDYHGRR